MKASIFSIISTVFLFTCTLYVQSGHAQSEHAESGVGILKSVSGQVSVLRKEKSTPAKAGDHLSAEDTLITKTDSYAGIIFTDGTTFTVGPDTEFKLNRYQFNPVQNEYDFSIYMKKGSGIYNSGKIGKLAPESINLSTPRASVGIRGTRFIINVE